MAQQPVRRAAVAGSWYPGSAAALAAEVDGYLGEASPGVPAGSVDAVIAPHAGLMYSGPVAAWAYRAVQGGRYEAVVLVGPSHQVGFEGAAVFRRGVFETPLGDAPIDEELAAAVLESTHVAREHPQAHAREHSLEMQLPFLRRVLPDAPIVPIVMGHQSSSTVTCLAEGLARALAGRRVLLVASSDLSHYLPAKSAAAMDARVLDLVGRFDPDGLCEALKSQPDHACGGGPMVAVMRASRALGARDARVLKYADSGDVSGDKSAVVGYMAAAFGRFAA
jgi:AmmeMemoRadiSam system protein B